VAILASLAASIAQARVWNRSLAALNTIIYIIEDDDAVRESLTALLESHGLMVEAFGSGEAFQRHAAAGLNGCVILDLQLPKRNGLQVLDWLRNTLGSTLPVVLVTGHGDEATRAALRAAGADFYVEKPFDTAALVKLIKTIIGERQPAADALA
jgi:FixJ family two-component response regulator